MHLLVAQLYGRLAGVQPPCLLELGKQKEEI